MQPPINTAGTLAGSMLRLEAFDKAKQMVLSATSGTA